MTAALQDVSTGATTRARTARVAPVDTRRAGPLTRIVNWVCRRRYGKPVAPVLVAARSPWTLRGMVAYELTLDRAHALATEVKDAAQVRAAEVVHCEYCMDISRAVMLRRGAAQDRVEAVARGDEEHLSDVDRAVLRFAEAMSVTPVAVDDAMVAELRRHLDEEQIVELTAAVAWENARARFNSALGITPDALRRLALERRRRS